MFFFCLNCKKYVNENTFKIKKTYKKKVIKIIYRKMKIK